MKTLERNSLYTYQDRQSMKSKKIILTDVDGVLLDWEYAFHVWMEQHGHNPVDGYRLKYNIGARFGIRKDLGRRLINIFNESASIGFLPPLRDSMYYVRKLHEQHGYVFHAITSLSKNPHAVKLREQNLAKLFGGSAFERVTCLDTGADKDDALKKYKNTNCLWIEDKIANADVGLKLGLRSIIMEHGHNMHYEGEAPLVKNWKEIYNLIIKR